jgi:hypothetical protein
MKPNVRQIIVFVALLTILALPHFVSAASYTTPSLWPGGFWGPLVSCTGNPYTFDAQGNKANNPNACQSLCDLIGTVLNVIYFIISICFFILVPIFFVIGGVMMMISAGNPERLSTGKTMLTRTVIGIVIVLCAYLVVATFVNFLGISGVGGFSSGSGTITCSAS